MARILLVEDESFCRDTLIKLIELRSSHKVTGAEHGKAALDWIAANGDPDVILLDLSMPVMDGFEFLSLYAGRAPVIVVSAWADDEDTRPRAAAYVRKPISSIDLFEAINLVLKAPR